MALQQHMFLGNGCEIDKRITTARQQILNKKEQTATAKKWLSKYVVTAMDMCTRMNDDVCTGRTKEL
jgi:hypothetical protein